LITLTARMRPVQKRAWPILESVIAHLLGFFWPDGKEPRSRREALLEIDFRLGQNKPCKPSKPCNFTWVSLGLHVRAG
jgi:hypothetical protein